MSQMGICTSIQVSASINNHVPGEGPLLVGVAHGDYTDAEIEESVEAIGLWTVADKIAKERANRLVRILGTFSGQNAAEVLWDGRQRKFKLNWRIEEGQSINFWIYNSDGTALSGATGAHVDGYANIKLV